MPLAALRINKKQYWGELYQIIYCNTAFDVKDDIEIRDISNSIYFGMSYFKNVKKKEDNKIQKQLVDLPYVELEVEKLGILTGAMFIWTEQYQIYVLLSRGKKLYILPHML